ncbi:MAG: hypothetical protein NXH80_16900, partial [Rhodobacteraceae bacterium]|nr:hypothetical protein [Paracoccaceae bacterium]
HRIGAGQDMLGFLSCGAGRICHCPVTWITPLAVSHDVSRKCDDWKKVHCFNGNTEAGGTATAGVIRVSGGFGDFGH